MSDFQTTEDSSVQLKQKLLDALRQETLKGGHLDNASFISMKASDLLSASGNRSSQQVEKTTSRQTEAPLGADLSSFEGTMRPDGGLPQRQSPPLDRMGSFESEGRQAPPMGQDDVKTDFNDKLSMRGAALNTAAQLSNTPPQAKLSTSQAKSVKLESVISGGSMADLSGYKDLSKAPMSFGDEEMPMSSLAPEAPFERASQLAAQQVFAQELPVQEVDTEFSGNVKTLIRLVNELPEGVTKQTGAQIIRLTMEAMGISMEDVLSEAQSAQSEMLDAVRANIKKIEEYKTVIRKLETDIKYYQGKANELSEIIDLFILSNTSGNKVPGAEF